MYIYEKKKNILIFFSKIVQEQCIVVHIPKMFWALMHTGCYTTICLGV